MLISRYKHSTRIGFYLLIHFYSLNIPILMHYFIDLKVIKFSVYEVSTGSNIIYKVGATSCTCASHGNKRWAIKDGPVFEVIEEEGPWSNFLLEKLVKEV